MFTHSKLHRGLLGIAGALAIGALSFGGALAAPPSVTQVITGGALTASVASATLPPLVYSNVAQPNPGTLNLSVSDATGLSKGWTVAISSTNFAYSGSSAFAQQPIPASGFLIVTAGAPTVDVAGQPIGAGGPTAGATGSLDVARTTISATAGFGSGAYKQDLSVLLNVPALSQAGTYTATLTVSAVAAP